MSTIVERSCTAQQSARPVRIMELCVLWYLSFQLPGDGQELILRKNGHSGGKWGTVKWGGQSTTFTGYPGTLIALAAPKLGFFDGKLNFKSAQCGLGCLHSGVSRSLELYLKGIVLMFCVFLSDSPNTREFGIILDLEQCLSAYIYLLNWLMASFCSHCQKFPTTPLTCTWLFQVLVVVNDNRTVPLHLFALPALQTDSIWAYFGLLWRFLCSLGKQPSPCTGEVPCGCIQVSSPAGHNSDLISGIPCTGTSGTSRNNSFPFTLNTLFVIKQDKDVNGLLLPEHLSCWGVVTLIYCLWMWPSIAGEFMDSFCSLTMQNEAVQGGWMGRAQECCLSLSLPI